MTTQSYSFDEFIEHYGDNYEVIHADASDNLVNATVHIIEYMKPRFPEQEVWMFKVQRFMLIVMYLATHIEDFDTEDFAVCGSKEVGALVSNHLLRAVHHFFESKSLMELKEPTVEEVLALAATYRPQEQPVITTD